MSRKKMSTVEQDSKSKVSENPSGSDNPETADEARKKGGNKPDYRTKEKPKSIDEYVWED